MLSKTKLAFCVVAIGALFHSCTFQQDGDTLTEVEIPAPTNTVIDFFQSQDTLLVRGHFSFSISASTPEPIKEYKIFVDDQEVSYNGGYPSYISFDSRNYADGIHSVTIELTKQRVSGSLASHAGLEVYTQTYSRKIDIYNKPIIAPELTTTIEDGELVVHWEPYTGPRFVRYRVSCPELFMFEEIDSPEQRSIQVPGFVGGKAKIIFSLYAFYESDTSSITYETFFEAKIERTQTGLRFQWGESPFKNSAGFKITMDANGLHQEAEFGNETNVVDLPASYAFPYDVSGTIHVVPRSGDNVLLKSRGYSTEAKVDENATRYLRFKQFIKHPTNDSLLLVYFLDDASETYDMRQGSLTLYNHFTGEKIKSIGGMIGVSPNGQHIYYYDWDGIINEIDPTDLSEKGGFSFRAISATGSLWQLHVSDDNKVLLYASQVTPGVNKYFVYDRNAQELLYTCRMTFGYGVHRTGSLGNGGRRFYNMDNKQVLSIDTDPATYFYLNASRKEIPLVHLHQSISEQGSNLLVKDLFPASTLYQVSYPNAVTRIFAGQDNKFGVVYVRDRKVKIDFFDYRNLNFLGTLETQLLTARVSDYVFSLTQNELFVYLYYNYDQGPAHHIKLDF